MIEKYDNKLFSGRHFRQNKKKIFFDGKYLSIKLLFNFNLKFSNYQFLISVRLKLFRIVCPFNLKNKL